MAIVPIVKVNSGAASKVLATKCDEITIFDNLLDQLVKDLLDTATAPESKAAGLSAPQIGVAKRVCVVRDFVYDENNPDNEIAIQYVLINPTLTHISDRKTINWEGCLSVPNIYGLVERAKKVKVEALNGKGEKFKMTAEGDLARVIQHELDHLNGVLYTSKVIGKTMTEDELDKLLTQKCKM